jgi:uncharacterized protein (TIGR02284 family)
MVIHHEQQKTQQTFAEFIKCNIDSIILYKKAIGYSRDREIRELLSKGLAKRIKYCIDLKDVIKIHEGTPAEGHTVIGMINKVWADIKTTISTDRERTMLEDINCHNKYVMDIYTKMLKPNCLPEQVRTLLIKQRLDIAYINKETDHITWLFV